jgi:hypothetical protein
MLCLALARRAQTATGLHNAFVGLVDALYNNDDLDGLGLTADAKAMLPDINGIAAPPPR